MPDTPILLLLPIEEKSDHFHFNNFPLIPNLKNYGQCLHVQCLHFKEKFCLNLAFSSNPTSENLEQHRQLNVETFIVFVCEDDFKYLMPAYIVLRKVMFSVVTVGEGRPTQAVVVP